jgi:hypothetical protein
MGRQCSVCNAEEHLPEINERLRAGESRAQIALQYGFSVDALDRHAKNHLQDRGKPAEGITAKWDQIITRAEELYQTAVKTGDQRGALGALKKLADAVEASARLGSKSNVGFEALTVQEQAERICSRPELIRAVMDYLVRDTGQSFNEFAGKCEAEIEAKDTKIIAHVSDNPIARH